MSAYSSLALALVVVALAVLAGVGLRVLRPLGRLTRQSRDLQRQLTEAAQLQARIAELNLRVVELQDGLERTKA